MILNEARVTNFRCVNDSGHFSVGPLTCLVGKNESGKTTLLQALHRLNPWHDDDGGFDRLIDYPRPRLLDYDTHHGGGEARAIETGWTLEPDDVAAIEERLGRGALATRNVRVTRDYGNAFEISVTVDERRIIAALAERAGVDRATADTLVTQGAIARAAAHLERDNAGLSAQARQLLADMDDLPERSAVNAARDIIIQRLPRFMYFGNVHRLPGKVSLDALRRRHDDGELTPSDSVFMDLLAMTGLTLEQVTDTARHEAMVARLEAASARLSEELLEYWSQEQHLRVRFGVDPGRAGDPAPFDSGLVMRTRIYNELHHMSMDFDERSSGFVWFYSFLVMFSRLRRGTSPAIVLLDEPGLSLHARGQRDLLAFIRERLVPNHQVIYTTHSPFMLPVDDLRAVRTVEDVVVRRDDGTLRSDGTRVGDEYLSTDEDTVYPLRTALAWEITRPLLGPGYTLLVDEPSTLLILHAFSSALKRRGHTPLDPHWKLAPVGSLNTLAAFLNLTAQSEGRVAVLLGSEAARSHEYDEVKRSWLLNQAAVVTARRYTGRANVDIEDIIGINAYVEIVNRALDLGESARIKAPESGTDTPAAMPWVRDALRRTSSEAATFDRMAIAMYLCAHIETLIDDIPSIKGALGRFESLYRDINSIIVDPSTTSDGAPRRP